jgi:hypothetical protein
MKYPRTAGTLLGLLLLGGCSSQPIVAIPKPSETAQAEVVIFRESSFIAGGVSLAVGIGSTAFASLSNSDYVSVNLPSGEQEIFVQARKADPTKLKLRLQSGSRLCLRTSASPSTFAKVAVPIALIATGYHFYLDEVPCPSVEELSKYKQVPITYTTS